MAKPRLAVVSPFIDKRHGTERRVAEWVARLTDDFEVHVYSNRVEDLDRSKLTWHRVPELRGPHLLKFLWWFGANAFCRWRDRRIRGLRPDLTFTAGTNCLDADVVSIHIVFAEFVRQAGEELRFRRHPIWFWPRLIHRRLYYALITALEWRIYTNPRTSLILIARKTAEDLARIYGVRRALPVVYIGLDHERFNPEARLAGRARAREALGYVDEDFVLLLIGNDWKKKGLGALLEALAQLKDGSIRLLVAGSDDRSLWLSRIAELGLAGKVRFEDSRADVEFFYSAADVYAGPSVEDTFAQPPAEAMACGLPVITSATNGTAEIMTDGEDGLIVPNGTDPVPIAEKIRLLIEEPQLRHRMGERAAQTALAYTWDRNGEEIKAILVNALQQKQGQS
ncbi:MAG: glycosyltransferase family 4 protein [Candidatus Acidiferrales bacterium]